MNMEPINGALLFIALKALPTSWSFGFESGHASKSGTPCVGWL